MFNIKNPIHFLAVGFGAGLLPKAPGTWGTLVAIPIYCLLAYGTLFFYTAWLLFTFILGCYLCHQTGIALGESDHGSIVFDEMVGYWIALYGIPYQLQNVVLAFLCFRLFDIVKPFPIRYFDAKFKNGFGVMFDDVLAGIMANACLQLLNFLSN